jgi:hypothetical protein
MSRLTVGRLVNLGVEPHLGLMTRYLSLFGSYSLVFVGRPLWQEDGSVFYICCWPLPAQSFLGPSPLGLAPIFYCLRFENSLFIAFYDSQGHGRGIQPRLHMGKLTDLTYPGQLYSLRMDHIENIVSTSSSIVVPWFIAGELGLPAIAKQWLSLLAFMSWYCNMRQLFFMILKKDLFHLRIILWHDSWTNKHCFQQFLCCWMLVCFHGNVLTVPLHSKGRLFFVPLLQLSAFIW